MGKFLIRKFGYFYCERCINAGKATGGVKLYKRKKQRDWPVHIDWLPLCDTHGVGYELYSTKTDNTKSDTLNPV